MIELESAASNFCCATLTFSFQNEPRVLHYRRAVRACDAASRNTSS